MSLWVLWKLGHCPWTILFYHLHSHDSETSKTKTKRKRSSYTTPFKRSYIHRSRSSIFHSRSTIRRWHQLGFNKQNILENIEKIVPTAISERKLFVNESKTEKYTIKRNGQNDWINCKLVGSKLGTEEDYRNRKTFLTNIAYNSVKTIFQNKNTTASAKLIIFNSLLESIFIYNSELWAVNKSLEYKIDTFQRQLLRKKFNIRYGENGENWLSNDQLYEVTKQTPWSKKISEISERRLRFFGHICRLPQNTPARLILSESLRPTKKPKGRPKTTYLSVLRNQLKDKNIKTLESALEIA